MAALLGNISTIVIEVIGWAGQAVRSLFTTGANGYWQNLLPLFLIGIAVSAVLLGIKVMRSLIWGA